MLTAEAALSGLAIRLGKHESRHDRDSLTRGSIGSETGSLQSHEQEGAYEGDTKSRFSATNLRPGILSGLTAALFDNRFDFCFPRQRPSPWQPLCQARRDTEGYLHHETGCPLRNGRLMETERIFHKSKPGIPQQGHGALHAVHFQHIVNRMPDKRSDLMTKRTASVAPADVHMWPSTLVHRLKWKKNFTMRQSRRSK